VPAASPKRSQQTFLLGWLRMPRAPLFAFFSLHRHPRSTLKGKTALGVNSREVAGKKKRKIQSPSVDIFVFNQLVFAFTHSRVIGPFFLIQPVEQLPL
jgi:hypothetical protein